MNAVSTHPQIPPEFLAARPVVQAIAILLSAIAFALAAIQVRKGK